MRRAWMPLMQEDREVMTQRFMTFDGGLEDHLLHVPREKSPKRERRTPDQGFAMFVDPVHARSLAPSMPCRPYTSGIRIKELCDRSIVPVAARDRGGAPLRRGGDDWTNRISWPVAELAGFTVDEAIVDGEPAVEPGRANDGFEQIR
jgi:hypothetical protein